EADGSTETFHEDGSCDCSDADGTEYHYDENGTSGSTEYPDGTTETYNDDGSYACDYGDGSHYECDAEGEGTYTDGTDESMSEGDAAAVIDPVYDENGMDADGNYAPGMGMDPMEEHGETAAEGEPAQGGEEFPNNEWEAGPEGEAGGPDADGNYAPGMGMDPDAEMADNQEAQGQESADIIDPTYDENGMDADGNYAPGMGMDPDAEGES
ncbi:MAG: hypothetical protein QGI45_06595, partial [Myxococcota bacterium]|nr:hypothetical protein [Myxococcota bacterium]